MPNFTRIQFLMRNQPRRILEIQERKNDDLLIFPKFINEIRRAGKPYAIRKHSKFSVHVSPQSEGFTINRHTDTAVDNYKDAIFVRPDRLGLRWLTYSFLVPLSSEQMEDVTSTTPAQTINLGSFDPDVSTAMVTLIISSPDITKIGYQSSLSKNSNCIKFNKFNIHLWTNYMDVPSIFRGREAMVLTSPSLLNGEPFEGRLIPDAYSHKLSEITRIQRQFMDNFSSHYLPNFFEEQAEAGWSLSTDQKISMRMNIKPKFSSKPNKKTKIKFDK